MFLFLFFPRHEDGEDPTSARSHTATFMALHPHPRYDILRPISRTLPRPDPPAASPPPGPTRGALLLALDRGLNLEKGKPKGEPEDDHRRHR